MTRREFIQKISYHGGAVAAMSALGFMNQATGFGADLSGLLSVAGKSGRKVVILGAGIAGMCAAYELGKLGFECVILESSGRTGGRSLTIRRGDTLTDTLGHKQTCEFDDGHYFNAGPARFAQWQITMDYCRELGVAIEPFINVNEAAYFYNENVTGSLNGKRLRQREAKADLRGYNAELLAKAINQDKLDQPLTGEDKEKLIDFLRREGDLDPDTLEYKGSSRRGYRIWPGGGMQAGEMDSAHGFKDLVLDNLIVHFHRANEYEYQPAMFQPVGGMDTLAKALAARVKDVIKTGTEVKEIRKLPKGARVVYVEAGETKEMSADFCICTIPPSILRGLQTDFSALLKTAITVVPFQNSARIGMQFKRRFWEEDDRVFGGISWTNQPINEIYYPSHGFFGRKGVLIGYYMFGPSSDEVTQMPPADRIAFAMAQGEKIHPQYHQEFENAFSVNWATVPHLKGCLAHFPEKLMKTLYPQLIKPDGAIYIAADWASHLGGWQAGAFESARLAVKDIHSRVSAA